MDLFWTAFKLRGFIRRNIWSTIINQFQHLFQGKSQKSFFMLFAYNQQLGSEAQAEWWPLAVYQALAGLAQSAQARSSVKRYQKISRLWVLAESLAKSGWWSSADHHPPGSVNSKCCSTLGISSQTAGNIWADSNPHQTRAFTTHPSHDLWWTHSLI